MTTAPHRSAFFACNTRTYLKSKTIVNSLFLGKIQKILGNLNVPEPSPNRARVVRNLWSHRKYFPDIAYSWNVAQEIHGMSGIPGCSTLGSSRCAVAMQWQCKGCALAMRWLCTATGRAEGVLWVRLFEFRFASLCSAVPLSVPLCLFEFRSASLSSVVPL